MLLAVSGRPARALRGVAGCEEGHPVVAACPVWMMTEYKGARRPFVGVGGDLGQLSQLTAAHDNDPCEPEELRQSVKTAVPPGAYSVSIRNEDSGVPRDWSAAGKDRGGVRVRLTSRLW
jgi:hypothetical protein